MHSRILRATSLSGGPLFLRHRAFHLPRKPCSFIWRSHRDLKLFLEFFTLGIISPTGQFFVTSDLWKEFLSPRTDRREKDSPKELSPVQGSPIEPSSRPKRQPRTSVLSFKNCNSTSTCNFVPDKGSAISERCPSRLHHLITKPAKYHSGHFLSEKTKKERYTCINLGLLSASTMW